MILPAIKPEASENRVCGGGQYHFTAAAFYRKGGRIAARHCPARTGNSLVNNIVSNAAPFCVNRYVGAGHAVKIHFSGKSTVIRKPAAENVTRAHRRYGQLEALLRKLRLIVIAVGAGRSVRLSVGGKIIIIAVRKRFVENKRTAVQHKRYSEYIGRLYRLAAAVNGLFELNAAFAKSRNIAFRAAYIYCAGQRKRG